MLLLCNVLWKVFIGSPMGTEQFIISVTNPDFSHCCFENCRLIVIRVQYRIVVVIIQQMVIIWYTGKVFIITQSEGFTGKWLHLRFVISKKALHLRNGLRRLFLVVDGCYFFSYITINIFDTIIALLFEIFQQVSLQELNILFDRRFTFWLARRWRKYYNIIETF